jgi:N-acetylmuramoyl-L-alanine amidase
MEIREQLIPLGHPNRPSIKIIPIAVVIHYTANDSPTADDISHASWVARKYKKINNTVYEYDGITKFYFGSAQWFIDDNSATLTIPTNEVAWACGDRNLPYDNGYKGQTKVAYEVFNNRQNYLTINYELCVNGDWDKTCENSIEIIAKDMFSYNISVDRIYRHFDLTNKICPKPFVDDYDAWLNYKNKIIRKVEMIQKSWEQKLGEQALDSLVQKGLINNVDDWKAKNLKNENVPLWLFFEMINRIS